MNDVLQKLKPRELQPRLELQCSTTSAPIYADCGCGISGCCPYADGVVLTTNCY
jgi:hypothetical protein